MILPFELDPQIIHHIIYSQAGSIGKAVIELIMNSVDAGANSVNLNVTRQGFNCIDDGKGFESREDVLRYFGRFGTPHEEGDATYGRFRLGRGQIMAHASTVWESNLWVMSVDTQKLGYNYVLEDLNESKKGCTITGMWYEELTDQEYMSNVQEIRDLVRYTPVSVNLNSKVITRDPKSEKWDFEDEFAYYRVKEEGAVSIYNQGVLVRHDAAHIWGAGGLIVSKKAIGLNVSRTEILRKTCPVWKAIAKQFKKMAEEIASRLGDHRKTEARREKYAHALLSGDPKIAEIFNKEEVITVLPGKRHLTMSDFLWKVHYGFKNKYTIVLDSFDIPKGEAIALQKIAMVLHPQTLDRFNCYNPIEFEECLVRILESVHENVITNNLQYYWREDYCNIPDHVLFSTLRDAFVYKTKIVTEKDSLDKETRRAWTALRWCLQQYTGACVGEKRYRNGRLHYKAKHMHILLGESNVAEAWTDGDSYIAFDKKVVIRLKTDPIKTAAYIFCLLEHEISHEGDSIDCGHDEAFYQRYHDISIRMATERQRYMHMWLMKYTISLELEGKPANGNAWRERYLLERTGNGRQKKGLSKAIEDIPVTFLNTQIPEENSTLIKLINLNLTDSGLNPEDPDWNSILEIAQIEAEKQKLLNESSDEVASNKEDLEEDYIPDWDEEYTYENYEDEEEYPSIDFTSEKDNLIEKQEEKLPKEFDGLTYPGETLWLLERNAAAAGFYRVLDYLKWRSEQNN